MELTTTTVLFGRMGLEAGGVHRWEIGIACKEQASIYNHVELSTYDT